MKKINKHVKKISNLIKKISNLKTYWPPPLLVDRFIKTKNEDDEDQILIKFIPHKKCH